MIDQSPVSALPVMIWVLSILGWDQLIHMLTAGTMNALLPATKKRIATVRSVVVMEHDLAMMSVLVLLALRHG